MEFLGQMRDHVSEACKLSKSKLARLKADFWSKLERGEDITASSRCIASHKGADWLEYGYRDSGDECVTVHFANGCHKPVNTTGDSLHSNSGTSAPAPYDGHSELVEEEESGKLPC